MLENIQEILNYWQPAPTWRRLPCWVWQILTTQPWASTPQGREALENQWIKRDGREGEMLINIAKHRNASDGN